MLNKRTFLNKDEYDDFNIRTFNDKRNPIWSPNKDEYKEGEKDFA